MKPRPGQARATVKREVFTMSKSFSFPNVGTCSKQTNIVLNDDHTIESIEVVGGCNGNLKASAACSRA